MRFTNGLRSAVSLSVFAAVCTQGALDDIGIGAQAPQTTSVTREDIFVPTPQRFRLLQDNRFVSLYVAFRAQARLRPEVRCYSRIPDQFLQSQRWMWTTRRTVCPRCLRRKGSMST
jgi:hypothetical protein